MYFLMGCFLYASSPKIRLKATLGNKELQKDNIPGVNAWLLLLLGELNEGIEYASSNSLSVPDFQVEFLRGAATKRIYGIHVKIVTLAESITKAQNT